MEILGKKSVLLVVLVVVTLAQMSTPVSAIDIDVWINAGTHYTVYITDAETGGTIDGDFTVTSGNDVEFFICDSDNYDRFLNSLSTSVYLHRSRTTTYSFDFTIPSDDTWYVVFSNEYSFITSKHLEGYVDYSPPSPVIPTVGTDIRVLALVGVVAIFSFIILLGIVKVWRDRTLSPTTHQDTYYEVVVPSAPQEPSEPYSPPQKPVAGHPFCSHCGTSRPPTARFCANCGATFETT